MDGRKCLGPEIWSAAVIYHHTGFLSLWVVGWNNHLMMMKLWLIVNNCFTLILYNLWHQEIQLLSCLKTTQLNGDSVDSMVKVWLWRQPHAPSVPCPWRNGKVKKWLYNTAKIHLSSVHCLVYKAIPCWLLVHYPLSVIVCDGWKSTSLNPSSKKPPYTFMFFLHIAVRLLGGGGSSGPFAA